MSVRDWRGTAKMTVKKLGEIIGTTTDTGGTATAGTLMAKVNALIGAFAAGVTAKSIKSVQFQTKTVKASTVEFTITEVNPDKTEVSISGGTMNGNYYSKPALTGLTATKVTLTTSGVPYTSAPVSIQVTEHY